MAASRKQVTQAKTLASQGASAKKIANQTGVSSNRANALVTKATAKSGSKTMPTSSKPTYNNPVQKAVATYTGDKGWDTGGKKFGGSDIKSLQGKGYNPNQIMKIAAAVGNIAGVNNRANTKLLAGFPAARRKGTNALTAAVFGSQSDNPLYAGLAREQGYSPKKRLTWGGITADGKPLALSGMDYSKDLYGKGSAYTWTPGKGLSEKAMDKLVNAKDAGPYDGMEIKPFDPNGPGPLAPKTDTPVEPLLPEIPPEEEKEDPFKDIGVGADLNSFATGWKSRLSSRKRAGSKAQGLASQRLAPVGKWQYNL